MRIVLSGDEKGQPKKYQYDLLDRTNKETNTLSMARTTGYTCTAAVNLVLDEKFTRKGVFPAEFIGEEEENFTFILNYLKERGVIYIISG